MSLTSLLVRPHTIQKVIQAEYGIPEGSEIWAAAENAYNERVARVENQIIARLRDRLGTARNANEMFRVFSKFNALFVRPKVNHAFNSPSLSNIDNEPDPWCYTRVSDATY